jgi:hypothetical protein
VRLTGVRHIISFYLTRRSSQGLPSTIDDGVGVHFRGTEPYRVVTPREKAGAYRVEAVNGVAHEESVLGEVERLHV